VERTLEVAKTVARPADFVDEAFGLIATLEAEEPYSLAIQCNKARIMAGLHVFAAGRLLDSGQPREALSHFVDACRYSPTAVVSVWYKVAQALGGVMGMGGVFLKYRRLRRAVLHRGRKLAVDSQGVRLR
jgi:hypothetical protein